jgi:hypothetical protein
MLVSVAGGVTAVTACSSFGSGAAESADAGDGATIGDGGTSTDGAIDDASDGSTGDGAALCDGGVHIAESFAGVSDVSLFHGWSTNPGNHAGTLDIAQTDAIMTGLTAPYLRAQSTITDAGSVRATIQRTIPLRPSHVTLAFDVGLGATDFYGEYGCALFLRRASNDGTYFNIHSDTPDHRHVKAQAEVDPGAISFGTFDVGNIPVGASRRITLNVDVDSTSHAAFTTTIEGPDGAFTSAPLTFELPGEVVETRVECGVIYGARGAFPDSGTLAVAVDNVDLLVCP